MGKTRNYAKLRVGLAIATIAGVAGTHAGIVAADQQQWAEADVAGVQVAAQPNNVAVAVPVAPEVDPAPTAERPIPTATPTATPTPAAGRASGCRACPPTGY